MKHVLKQMQYLFAVTFGKLSTTFLMSQFVTLVFEKKTQNEQPDISFLCHYRGNPTPYTDQNKCL